MTEKPMDATQVRGEVAELKRQLLAMGTMVESLMAASLVALLDGDAAAASELREDDCRTHEQCLEVDKLCTELLTSGRPDAGQVRFISAAIKIAGAFKRAGDEALRIAEGMRSCHSDCLATAKTLASVPRLAELAQGMLNDCIESLINCDPDRAAGMHEAFRTLAASHRSAVLTLAQALSDGEVSVPAGAALAGVAQRLERVGDEVLEAATHVRHFYLRDRDQEAG